MCSKVRMPQSANQVTCLMQAQWKVRWQGQVSATCRVIVVMATEAARLRKWDKWSCSVSIVSGLVFLCQEGQLSLKHPSMEADRINWSTPREIICSRLSVSVLLQSGKLNNSESTAGRKWSTKQKIKLEVVQARHLVVRESVSVSPQRTEYGHNLFKVANMSTVRCLCNS